MTFTATPQTNPFASTGGAYGVRRSGPDASRFLEDGLGAMSQSRLLVALYERLVIDIDAAAAALHGPAPHTGAAIYQAHERLTHAQRIVEELQLALDPDAWDGAVALAGIYDFLLGRLVAANLEKDPTIIAECRILVTPLLEAWREAAEQLQQGPVAPVVPAAVRTVA